MSFQREKPNYHLPVKQFIRKEVQPEVYQDDVKSVIKGSKPPKTSSFLSINLFLDPESFEFGDACSTCPLIDLMETIMFQSSFQRPSYCIIPMCHFLCNTQHQGLHLTEYAIRTAGFWPVGGMPTIIYVLRRCVTCKKLRRSFAWTKMHTFLWTD